MAVDVTPAMLVGMTGCSPIAAALWSIPLDEAAKEFGLNTEARLPHFLAQCAHESAQFTRVVESMNYSARRLTQVWPTRFPTMESTAPFFDASGHVRQAMLANFVYGGRNGNGPAATGDGWKFIGRTPVQLTGRGNYTWAHRKTGIDCILHPEAIEPPIPGARVAAAYFLERCAAAADRGDLAGVVRGIQPGAGRDELQKRIALSEAAMAAMA